MEQQVWILRNFLGELERRKVVDEGIPNEIAGEFARLKSQSTKYRTDKTFPTKTAEKQENIKKNRYKDIVPFDHTRVKLTFTSSKNETDYINANFIKGVSGSRAYIATQGPLPHTILDFLRMLWEYNVKIVVMACREFEMGKKKCERYWPQQKDQPFVCESFTVYCDSEENKGEYLTRTLRVTYRNSSRTLIQLHYVNWPDHGVPDSIPPILEMLHEMRSYQDHDDNPICIHCSAGCGRTGVLCVIDYTWNLLRKQMIPPDFNIYDLVQNMRTQRPSVVQTKEQYELVYRTIRLLFQRYLESMDAQPCSNKVSLVPPVTQCDLFDLNDEMELLPHLQHLLHEERDVLVQYHKSSTSPTAVNHITSRVKDIHMEQQERHQHQTFPDAVVKSPDLLEGSRTSPKAMHLSPIAPVAKDIIQGCDELQSLNPEPVTAVAEAICMMVEDPYFNAPMTPPSSDSAAMEPTKVIKDWNTPVVLLNEQTLDLNSPVSDTSETQMSDDAPPPLPERTPESYILAVDTEPSDPCERSSFIIPPNTAAEATRELGGSPPSPVPPLPERTAESFELDTDQAPVETNLMVTPTVNLNRIGTSSEWSGDSRPATAAAAAVSHTETKPWKRSKSLKTKMTFTAVTHFDLQPTETLNFHPIQPPLEPQASPVISQSDDSLTPPLPDRTPESFILKTEVQQQTPLCPQPTGKTQPAPKVGMSSEWDGSSQPKKFLDVVMCRSKSVRVKNSTQEPLTVAQPFTTPPVVVAEAGSAQVGPHDVNHRHSMNASTSGNKSDKSNDKCMSRTKSLFFRHKQKTAKMASPSTPDQPGTSPATFSVFKFGFGNRFGKPKGPRSYPETWI